LLYFTRIVVGRLMKASQTVKN